MNWLDDIYQNKTASPAQHTELAEKTAQLELFAKLAAEEGIDLATLTAPQVNEFFAQFQAKLAEEEEKEDKGEKKEEDKEKEKDDKPAPPPFAAAKAEHDEKKEAAAAIAQAEFMGEVMANSFIRTLDTHEKTAAAKAAAASAPVPSTETTADRIVKKASAFDVHAARVAVKLAGEGQFDSDEAADRIGAVLLLGAPESTKVAQVQDTDAALNVRALELLELAGYPVTWEA